jgi:molybdenum cofactor cytidylyltransferase
MWRLRFRKNEFARMENYLSGTPRGEFAIVLLAAGSSSRMGQSKQLLSIDGKPLLLKSAEAVLGVCANKTIVVLGSGEQAHRKIIDHLPLEIISNPDWEKGMGTSIRRGLTSALELVQGMEAVMIVVCDQPLITSGHLKNLIGKYKSTKNAIVASAYANTIGVPALFDQSLFQQLLAVEDGQGAKKILLDHADSVLSIDFPDGAVDLDTPEDFRDFLKRSTN